MSKYFLYMSSLLTPTELIELYPEVESQFGWSAKHLGVFLICRLLKGSYNTNLRVSMIEQESLLALIQYTNNLLDEQKVQIQYG